MIGGLGSRRWIPARCSCKRFSTRCRDKCRGSHPVDRGGGPLHTVFGRGSLGKLLRLRMPTNLSSVLKCYCGLSSDSRETGKWVEQQTVEFFDALKSSYPTLWNLKAAM